MVFSPVSTLQKLVKAGKKAEFCFFSYIDTTADPEEWEKMTQCHQRSYHGRGIFRQLFNWSVDSTEIGGQSSQEQQELFYLPLGDILHRNSERSCALTLLEEMLGPNFKIRSRTLHELTKTPDYEDYGCCSCPAKWNRVGLFIEFVPVARPRNEYIHSLWSNLDTFTFVEPRQTCLNILPPILTKEDEWLA